MTENPDPRAATPPPHRFGVAAELDRIQKGAPPRKRPPPAPMRRRGRGRLGTWWASREGRPSDVWHRVRCRSGHHDVRGGQQMQLGARFVYVERACVWCGAKPLGPGPGGGRYR